MLCPNDMIHTKAVELCVEINLLKFICLHILSKSINKVALKPQNSLIAPPNACSSFSREIAMACQQQRNRCSKFCPKTTVSLVNYRSCSFCNKLSIPPRATNNGLTVTKCVPRVKKYSKF